MRRDRITAGRGIGRVDGGSRVFAAYHATGGAPGVSHGVLRIEIAADNCGRQRLTHQNFRGLDRARGSRSHSGSTAPTENQARPQPHTGQRRTAQIRKVRGGEIRIVLPRPNIIRFEQAECESPANRQIHSTTQNRADAVGPIQTGYRQTVQAQQGMQEEVGVFGAPHKSGAERGSGVVVALLEPVMAEVHFASPMRIEVKGKCPTHARAVRDRKRSGIARIAKRRRHRGAGMHPLISHKNVPLRSRVSLRECRTRKYSCAQHNGTKQG